MRYVAEDPTPRINRISFKGGIGLITVVLLMIGFLVEVPATRLWIYIAIPVGVILAIYFHYRNP